MARQLPPRDSIPAPRRAGGFAQRVARLWGGEGRDAAGPWMPTDAFYPRLQRLDIAAAGLPRQSGLYACWHLGVRARWVRVGGAMDLGVAIVRLQQHDEIVSYDAHGGLFVAWALLPADTLPGAVRFLAEHLSPVLQSLVIAGEIVPAAIGTTFPFPPGTQPAVPPTEKPLPKG